MFKIIEEKIKTSKNNLISYADFIEIALYDERYGYYMTDLNKIGKDGDFITSSNFGDTFGYVIGKWYASLYQKHHLPAAVCELGGGNGRFAQAFMNGWEENCSESLNYIIVETSPYHRKKQQENIKNNHNFIQYETIEQVKQFSGLLFANELYDALPVHLVTMSDGILAEIMVGLSNDELIEYFVPLENKDIINFIKKYKFELVEGQRIEVPLAMVKYIEILKSNINSCLSVMVDYCYSTNKLQDRHRKDGSLRGFYRHQLIHNVLKNVGEMDITSDVHLDSFIKEGKEQGFSYITHLKQADFLVKIGIMEELVAHNDSDPFSVNSRRNRAIRSLIMSDVGKSFDVVVQQLGYEFTEEQLFIK